jgi:hypothetical protein
MATQPGGDIAFYFAQAFYCRYFLTSKGFVHGALAGITV